MGKVGANSQKERSDPWHLVVIELQKINGRLSCIEDQITSINTKHKRIKVARHYYLRQIKCLQVEKQKLVDYTKELEKFNNLPT